MLLLLSLTLFESFQISFPCRFWISIFLNCVPFCYDVIMKFMETLGNSSYSSANKGIDPINVFLGYIIPWTIVFSDLLVNHRDSTKSIDSGKH